MDKPGDMISDNIEVVPVVVLSQIPRASVVYPEYS